jgi:hypothetical protein
MAERSMALRSGNWYSPRGATTNPLRSLERGVGSNPTLFSYDQLWSLVGYGVAVTSMTLTHQPGVRLPVSEIFLRPMPRIIACLPWSDLEERARSILVSFPQQHFVDHSWAEGHDSRQCFPAHYIHLQTQHHKRVLSL